MMSIEFPENSLHCNRIVHQIWLDSEPPPPATLRCMKSTAVGLPGWEVKLWGKSDILEVVDRFICRDIVLDASIGMRIRPDIIRYELLRLFGGVSADADFEFFLPIEEILIGDCLHLGMDGRQRTGGALLASPKDHPFWTFILEGMRGKVTGAAEFRTGQREYLRTLSLHRAVLDWLKNDWSCREVISPAGHPAGWLYDHADVVIWSSDAVYIYPDNFQFHKQFSREDYPYLYGAHHWTGVWLGESY